MLFACSFGGCHPSCTTCNLVPPADAKLCAFSASLLIQEVEHCGVATGSAS